MSKAQEIARWLDRGGLSDGQIARLVGCSQVYVSRIARQQGRPALSRAETVDRSLVSRAACRDARREEIRQRAARGETVAQTAQEMGLSVSCVSHHRGALGIAADQTVSIHAATRARAARWMQRRARAHEMRAAGHPIEDIAAAVGVHILTVCEYLGIEP